jgi:hypothetical protein
MNQKKKTNANAQRQKKSPASPITNSVAFAHPMSATKPLAIKHMAEKLPSQMPQIFKQTHHY